jgi:hypothetical protein
MTGDERWMRDFVLELRLRGVNGSTIGDAVASVRELLRDSGQSAAEAFGQPRAYAASLELPGTHRRFGLVSAVTQSLVGLVAFTGFAKATTSWLDGQEFVVISSAQLLLLALACLVVLLLPLCVNALLRHRWLLVAVALAGVATGVAMYSTDARGSAAPNLYGASLSVYPVVLVVATALVMVLLSVVQTVAAVRLVGIDPVREPIVSPEAPSWGRHAVGISVGMAWMFPVGGVLFLGATYLLAR